MKKLITLLVLFLAINIFAQNTYVPDDNFEQALIDLGYDSGALDDYVPTANINAITNLNVSNKNISDLTGIEDFTALTTLSCQYNNLNSLDISSNTALTVLSCHANNLSSLDVSSNTALTDLSCSSNNLSSLEVSTNTALITLYCYHNNLTNLDVSANTVLTTLVCNQNDLVSLDVSSNTELIELKCSQNNLTSLDVSANPALTKLECFINNLMSLDVSANPALTTLKCYSSHLSYLNIKNGNNTAILDIFFNATNNPNLTCILVDDATWSANNWTSIDAQMHFVNSQAECDALYVDETDLENSIIIYPNPAKNVLNITNNSNETITEITMYSVLGKKVYSSLIIQNTIDIRNLKSGLYLLKIKSNDKSVIKKIVISK